MNHKNKDTPFHLAGWILFLACAFLFLFVAMRDGDIVLALASLLFLAGCIAFLVPLVFPGRPSDETHPSRERPTIRKEEEK